MNAAPWWACAALSTSGRFFDTSKPRATNRAPAAERESARVGRPVDRAQRGRGRGGADAAGGRVLAFGQAVDLVVEQQDLQVHVAPQHMHQVVAANRQPIAVAGHHPHVELRVGELDPGREGRRAAVDRVEAVAFDVIRETGSNSRCR